MVFVNPLAGGALFVRGPNLSALERTAPQSTRQAAVAGALRDDARFVLRQCTHTGDIESFRYKKDETIAKHCGPAKSQPHFAQKTNST